MKKLIIAADAEPVVHVSQKEKIIQKNPAGGVAIAFHSVLSNSKNGTFIARGKTEEDRAVTDHSGRAIIETDDNNYTLKRIFLSERETNDYYYGYSNQSLWPLCHRVFHKPVFSDKWLTNYQKVNKIFADAINEELTDESTIWINDYQLSLTPKIVKKRKSTKLLMFWHIPWPDPETFSILPESNEILESMLHSDIIGFHTKNFAHNFAKTVQKILKKDVSITGSTVSKSKHKTKIITHPISIDTKNTLNILETRSKKPIHKKVIASVLKSEFEKLSNKYKVVLGVDRLDYTKGLEERLSAIDRFFELYPEYKEKVTYFGQIAPSKGKIQTYQDLETRLKNMSKEINKKHEQNGWNPINLSVQTVSRQDLFNMYAKSQVCLITPLEDGLNLVAKEYVYTSFLAKSDGALILSRYAGAAEELEESFITNPFSPKEIAETINTALLTSPSSRRERLGKMAKRLEKNNVENWASKFMNS